MTVTVTMGTASLLQLLVFAHHRGRDNARGDGNDGIADEHNDGGYETSHWRNRRDVAIAHSSHGDDGPVDAVGDIVELRVWGIAFDGIHHRAHGRDEDEHEKEEDENLRCTDPQRPQEQVAFVDKGEELENSEDTYEAEGTDDEQVVRTVEKETQVNRQCSQQVNDTEKAEDVLPRLFQAVDACQIFNGENQCEYVFQYPQYEVGRMRKDMHALQYDEQYAEYNAANEDDVEQFTFGRVRFEYDGVDFLFQLLIVQEVVPALAQGGKYFIMFFAAYYVAKLAINMK